MRTRDFASYGYQRQGGCWVWCADAAFLSRHGLRTLDSFLRLEAGQPISRKRGRCTVVIEREGRRFYLKRSAVHPRELLKNLLRGHVNQPGPLHEAAAALAIRETGLRTVHVAAFGVRRRLGLETEAFILIEHLYDHESVEAAARRQWAPPLAGSRYAAKRQLLLQLADFTARFHAEGFHHQDYYLSHLFTDPAGHVAVIDVQRVIHRKRLRPRQRVKDLAQLHFSGLFIERVTRADALRFYLRYRGRQRAIELDARDRRVIRAVRRKVAGIARHTVKLLARRRRRGEIPPADATGADATGVRATGAGAGAAPVRSDGC
jgi:heptose I phosphotransferase